MRLEWPFKDPDEVLDYEIDYSSRLNGDAIISSTWIIPAGIVMDSAFASATVSTIWLSGGTIGETYTLVNRIITSGGRTMDQSVRLKIRAR